jgi:hypothetical protein
MGRTRTKKLRNVFLAIFALLAAGAFINEQLGSSVEVIGVVRDQRVAPYRDQSNQDYRLFVELEDGSRVEMNVPATTQFRKDRRASITKVTGYLFRGDYYRFNRYLDSP